MTQPIRLALTMGDPAGIGPEIIVKAAHEMRNLVDQGIEIHVRPRRRSHMPFGSRGDRHSSGGAEHLAVDVRAVAEIVVEQARQIGDRHPRLGAAVVGGFVAE